MSLLSEEQERIKMGGGVQVLKDDVIYLVITMGERAWGLKNNADCLHTVSPPSSLSPP